MPILYTSDQSTSLIVGKVDKGLFVDFLSLYAFNFFIALLWLDDFKKHVVTLQMWELCKNICLYII